MARLAAAETVTAGSLDAMRAYARAQELSLTSKFQEALAEYQRAVELDPGFGRAYAGMAGVYANYFKQPEKAEASYQTALKHIDRMTEREKYRTLGTYYLDIARNYEKAIENYETLVKLYPADDGGHGNLALAYSCSAATCRGPWRKCGRAWRSTRRIRCSATTTRCTRCTPVISPPRSPRRRGSWRRTRRSNTPSCRSRCRSWRRATPPPAARPTTGSLR